MDTLLLGGVELSVSPAPLQLDGRTWPAGSIVIPRAQPYGQHVKDLFEVQRYPEGDSPYDVAGWTLPLLLGVHRVEVMQELGELELTRAATVEEATAGFRGAGRDGLRDGRDSDTWKWVFERLAAGSPVDLQTAGPAAGSFSGSPRQSTDEETWVAFPQMPRVGLYAPWSGSMDEGWMRWVLDTWGVPYVRVRNEMIRAGRLGELLDVLLVPSVSNRQLDAGRRPGTVMEEYSRGLDPEGAVAIEEFVREGGTLIAMSSSAGWAVELFELPLVDVTRGPGAGEFSCPGSVLRGIPEAAPHTAGLPTSLALFFSRSSAWRIEQPDDDEEGAEERAVEVLLRYAPTRLLLSGWIRAPEVIEDHVAWARVPHGEGAVHLFGFRPQYRSWSQATFPLLFRAMLLR